MASIQEGSSLSPQATSAIVGALSSSPFGRAFLAYVAQGLGHDPAEGLTYNEAHIGAYSAVLACLPNLGLVSPTTVPGDNTTTSLGAQLVHFADTPLVFDGLLVVEAAGAATISSVVTVTDPAADLDLDLTERQDGIGTDLVYHGGRTVLLWPTTGLADLGIRVTTSDGSDVQVHGYYLTQSALGDPTP